MGAREYRGRGSPSKVASEDFGLWTDSNHLIHVMTRCNQFTWANGRRGAALTEKRLDRAVINNECIDFCTDISCCTLVRSKSDHFPILLNLEKDNRRHASSFKFMRMWHSHPDCGKLVEDAWKIPVFGCPLFVLTEKLKNVKAKLKVWNRKDFGDVNENVKAAEMELNQIQSEIDLGGATDLLNTQENEAQRKLHQALNFQLEFWLEKSRFNWHVKEDRNIDYFHKIEKIRHVTKQISMLKEDDQVLSSREEIEQHAVNYFVNLFSSSNSCVDNGLVEGSFLVW